LEGISTLNLTIFLGSMRLASFNRVAIDSVARGGPVDDDDDDGLFFDANDDADADDDDDDVVVVMIVVGLVKFKNKPSLPIPPIRLDARNISLFSDSDGRLGQLDCTTTKERPQSQ